MLGAVFLLSFLLLSNGKHSRSVILTYEGRVDKGFVLFNRDSDQIVVGWLGIGLYPTFYLNPNPNPNRNPTRTPNSYP